MSASTAAIAGIITAAAFAVVTALFLLVFWLLDAFGVMAVIAAWVGISFACAWRWIYCHMQSRAAMKEKR